MATNIYVRSDRGSMGIMPATQLTTALVADSLVKGQAVKLDSSDGQLAAAAGASTSVAAAPEFLMVGAYTANVTHPSGTTYDASVVPILDSLTYSADCYDAALSDSSFSPNPGAVARLNAANEPTTGFSAGTCLIVDATAADNTDAKILAVEEDGTGSGVPARVKFQFIGLAV